MNIVHADIATGLRLGFLTVWTKAHRCFRFGQCFGHPKCVLVTLNVNKNMRTLSFSSLTPVGDESV